MSEDRLLRCSLFRSLPFWSLLMSLTTLRLCTKGKLTPEQRLEELSTHFWENFCFSVGLGGGIGFGILNLNRHGALSKKSEVRSQRAEFEIKNLKSGILDLMSSDLRPLSPLVPSGSLAI